MLYITNEAREELPGAFGEAEEKRAVRVYLSGTG